jgi:hypothetical protein
MNLKVEGFILTQWFQFMNTSVHCFQFYGKLEGYGRRSQQMRALMVAKKQRDFFSGTWNKMYPSKSHYQ